MILLYDGPTGDSDSGGEAAKVLISRTGEFFAAGGPLAQTLKAAEWAYEHRPQQVRMAEAVARAVALRRHLAVEAGTGVGKSFAYLVPVILRALEAHEKAVVATYTISLQEQLMYKDIPVLQRSLGEPFRAVLVKGRNNYLCLRRLARALQMARDLFARDQENELRRLGIWAERTEDGSLQDLSPPPSAEVWGAVCAEEDNCPGPRCPDFARCFFLRARRAAQEADLLVANHHLLFADLALRTAQAALLPEYTTVVIDEAHQIEGVASDHFGIRLSERAFEHWIRRVYHAESQKGLLAIVRDGAGAQEVQLLAEDVGRLYAAVRERVGLDDAHPVRAVRRPLDIETPVTTRLRAICERLRELYHVQPDEDLAAELRQAERRGLELATTLEAFLFHLAADHVYWVEREGRRAQTVFYSAPIEVAPLLREHLFGEIPCVILTSATLAVNGSLAYFRTRIGAESCDELQVGSPFDYARQMRVWIPARMPDPTSGDDRYAPACAEAIRHFARLTRGNALVLFTNGELMRRTAAIAREPLERDGLRLLVQNEGMARRALLEDFRTGGAVLFGLDSFWMGVDVRGEALSNVIITRLPFSVPDHPLTQARLERIRERGGDPFREYSLPEAVIKFRQGVGRLIRSATDTGVIVILDRRVVTKWYGRWFLGALPEVPVEIVDWQPATGGPDLGADATGGQTGSPPAGG